MRTAPLPISMSPRSRSLLWVALSAMARSRTISSWSRAPSPVPRSVSLLYASRCTSTLLARLLRRLPSRYVLFNIPTHKNKPLLTFLKWIDTSSGKPQMIFIILLDLTNNLIQNSVMEVTRLSRRRSSTRVCSRRMSSALLRGFRFTRSDLVSLARRGPMVLSKKMCRVLASNVGLSLQWSWRQGWLDGLVVSIRAFSKLNRTKSKTLNTCSPLVGHHLAVLCFPGPNFPRLPGNNTRHQAETIALDDCASGNIQGQARLSLYHFAPSSTV